MNHAAINKHATKKSRKLLNHITEIKNALNSQLEIFYDNFLSNVKLTQSEDMFELHSEGDDVSVLLGDFEIINIQNAKFSIHLVRDGIDIKGEFTFDEMLDQFGKHIDLGKIGLR